MRAEHALPGGVVLEDLLERARGLRLDARAEHLRDAFRGRASGRRRLHAAQFARLDQRRFRRSVRRRRPFLGDNIT
jgi:hypothetical protein